MMKSNNWWQILSIFLSVVILTLGILLGTTLSKVAAFSESTLAQISNASQLKDVQPSDYYFQSLQSLIKKYKVNVAYPDGTFKADRPMTRGDFAIFLNDGLNNISQSITTETADLSTLADLAHLQKMAEELEQKIAAIEKWQNGLPLDK